MQILTMFAMFMCCCVLSIYLPLVLLTERVPRSLEVVLLTGLDIKKPLFINHKGVGDFLCGLPIL